MPCTEKIINYRLFCIRKFIQATNRPHFDETKPSQVPSEYHLTFQACTLCFQNAQRKDWAARAKISKRCMKMQSHINV